MNYLILEFLICIIGLKKIEINDAYLIHPLEDYQRLFFFLELLPFLPFFDFDLSHAIIFFIFDFLLLLLALRPLIFILFFVFFAILSIKLTYGLGGKVPQTITEINLNLSVCFKGYLLRAIFSRDRCRFRMVSYSPFTTLIAEHPLEANMNTSFPGQPNSPSQLILKAMEQL